MRTARGVGLVALCVACSDSTHPPAQVAPPPLEAIPYSLLGTGKIGFERITEDFHAVYLIDPSKSSTTIPVRGDFNAPALSPDGRQIAITGYSGSLTQWDVYVVDEADGGSRRLSGYRYDEGAPSWTPGGGTLTFLRSQEGSLDMAITEVRVSDGAPQRTVTLRRDDGCPAPFTYGGNPEYRVEVSANGSIATPCGLTMLVILSSGGIRIATHAVMPPTIITGFGWSPDGSKLAIVETTGDYSIGIPVAVTLRIIAADGGSPREVFTMPLSLTQNGRYPGAMDSSVCWLSGVDRLIVNIPYEARRYSQLWVVNEDGTGLTRITTASNATDRSVSCAR